MAELADAQASGACLGSQVQVQVLLPAPYRVSLLDLKSIRTLFLCFKQQMRHIEYLRPAVCLFVHCFLAVFQNQVSL